MSIFELAKNPVAWNAPSSSEEEIAVKLRKRGHSINEIHNETGIVKDRIVKFLRKHKMNDMDYPRRRIVELMELLKEAGVEEPGF